MRARHAALFALFLALASLAPEPSWADGGEVAELSDAQKKKAKKKKSKSDDETELPPSAGSGADSSSEKSGSNSIEETSIENIPSDEADVDSVDESDDGQGAAASEEGRAEPLSLTEEELLARAQEEAIRAREEKVIAAVGGLSVDSSAYAQEAVKKFIRSFSSEQGRKHLFEALDRGETYRLYVRQKLKERNMPAALEYLPLIESDYLPKATSRVGAKGIWQFMENSMRPFLKKSGWIDERLDPWRSTDAAISKLQDNYRQFGDWLLAIAAYNCGSGAMQRALSVSKEKDFWHLAEKKILKAQTIQYVPKLIAAAEIAENSEFYGIDLPEITASPRFAEFDYVLVQEKISLLRLAAELCMDADYLKFLNPALTRSATPSGDEYELRFPFGMEAAARIAIDDILANPDAFWDNFESVHVVQSGDTLWGIARKNGCTVEELCQLNKMKETDVLKIGKELKIPVPY